MYNIIKCELFKLKKTNSFWIIMAVMAVSGVLMGILGYAQQGRLIEMGMESELTGITMYLSDLKDISLIIIMGSILTGTFISSDFENRIMQAAIAGGSGRTSLLIGKSLVYFLAISMILLPYPITSIIVMTLLFSLGAPLSGALILQLIAMLIATFFINAALMSISILFGFIFKKSGLVIGISVAVLVIAGNLLISIGNMFAPLGKVLRYTPLGLHRIILSLEAAPKDFITVIIVSIIYIIGFMGIGIMLFRKMELK